MEKISAERECKQCACCVETTDDCISSSELSGDIARYFSETKKISLSKEEITKIVQFYICLACQTNALIALSYEEYDPMCDSCSKYAPICGRPNCHLTICSCFRSDKCDACRYTLCQDCMYTLNEYNSYSICNRCYATKTSEYEDSYSTSSDDCYIMDLE